MINHEFKVNVVDYGRAWLYMRYKDPLTGKAITKSTKCTTRKAALKVAGAWEDDLRNGRYKPASKVTWQEFRRRYETEVLDGYRSTSAAKNSGVLDSVEAELQPDKPASLTADRLSHYQSILRKRGLSEFTIKGHLSVVRSSLNWAKRMGLVHEVPNIEMPQRAKGSKMMKGRPVSGEEFDRLLAAVCKVRSGDAADWQRFLRGLWWSGLRLEEALELWWDKDNSVCVDLSDRRPMLRVPAECEKGNQDRLLPIAPEFAEFLLATPERERTGLVFRLPFTRKDTVSKTISAIGEKAAVKVNTDARTAKVKFASAHDLRRSFGERWAARVMPQVLMQLMRHESIETTMKFYVGRNAQTTADVLYAAVSGNTSGNSGVSADSANAVTPDHEKRTAQDSNLQPSVP